MEAKRYLYIILGFMVMMLLGTVYSYSVFRSSIEQLYGIGTTHSGLPYMVSLASYALFMYLTGRVAERYEPKRLLCAGGLLVSLGWISSSFAKDILTLTLTYGVLAGAGVGIAYGIPMSVVAKWFPEKKGLAVGLVLVGFGLSPLATAPLARTLVMELGLMDAFRALGILFGLLIPILAIPFKNPPRIDTGSMTLSEGMDVSGMIRSRSFKYLYINFIIGTMIGLMMVGMTAGVGKEYVSLDSSHITLLISTFAVFNGVGRPGFGWLTDRIGVWNAMGISYALILVASLGLLLFGNDNATVYTLCYAMYWMNLGGWLAIAPAATMALFGTVHYSKNYGVVFTAYGIGAIAGVLTSGMILDHHGDYRMVFGYIILLCVAGLISTRMVTEKVF